MQGKLQRDNVYLRLNARQAYVLTRGALPANRRSRLTPAGAPPAPNPLRRGKGERGLALEADPGVGGNATITTIRRGPDYCRRRQALRIGGPAPPKNPPQCLMRPGSCSTENGVRRLVSVNCEGAER